MAGATGTAPVFGPCSTYASWEDVTGCGCSATVDATEDQELWLAVATEIVWGITDGKYAGQCVRSYTPCRPACAKAGSCTCSSRVALDLGPQPVWGVFVTIDGEAIEVEVQDWRYVVRTDGLDWPACGAGAWVVEYTYGWPVPVSIRMATARLACELAKQCAGQPCGLDPKTTSYTREGMTVQISDPAAMVEQRKTGIDFVDRILGNPMYRLGGQLVDLAAEGGHYASWQP